MKLSSLALLMGLSVFSIAQSSAVRLHEIKVRKDIIEILGSVEKQGRPVHSLKANDFRIYASGVPVDILSCTSQGSGQDQVALTIVIDASGSLKGSRLDECRRSAIDLISNLRDGDEVGLVRIGSTPTLAVSPTTDRAAVKDALQALQPHGKSAIFDGVAFALESLKNSRAPRKAVILLTDGGENASRKTADEVAKQAKASGIEVHLLLVESSESPGLAKIADESGGTTRIISQLSILANLYRGIAELLTSNYVLNGRLPKNVGQSATIRLEAPDVVFGNSDERSVPVSLTSGEHAAVGTSTTLPVMAMVALLAANIGLGAALLLRSRKGVRK